MTLSLLVHFLYFGLPNQVVFDEVWYGRHVNDYINGTFHFDGHPPLGRMTVAGFAKIFNYKPSSGFLNIGEKFPDKQYMILRFLPSLAGALLPVVIFLIMQELGISLLASLAGSLMIVFDNALLVQSRFLLMDAFLLLYGFTSLLFYFRYRNRGGKLNLLLTGTFAGLAFSVKWVGLSYVGLPVVLEGLGLLGQVKNGGLFSINWRKFLFTFTALVAIPLAIYFCIITAYSSLLYKSGTGDAFMSPGYQKTLQGNQYQGRQDIETPNVFEKFYELNVRMYQVNQTLTATHSYSSRWYTWPFMIRPVYYWLSTSDSSPTEQKIYLLGNPVIWWGSTIAIAYALLFAVKSLWQKVRNLRSSLPTAAKTTCILLTGYFLNLLPYIGIKRIMFLYHYLAALIFAVIIFTYLVDRTKNRRKILITVIAAAIVLFIYFAPLSYGLPLEAGSFTNRMWLTSWQ